MTKYWRCFRLDGEIPRSSKSTFMYEIHHGGRFYRLGEHREYRGGETCWLDNQDPDLVAWTELNEISWNLGYRLGLICYWGRPGGSSQQFRELKSDQEFTHLVTDLTANRVFELYIVRGGEREIEREREKSLCELE